MSDEERAKQNIFKVGIERHLCEAFAPFLDDGEGYDVIASLMCTNAHNINKFIGYALRKIESMYSIERPKNWNNFSKKVSENIYDDNYRNLSKKTQGLRKAVYSLAVLADCFEFIEKSELKLKEDQ